MSAVKSSTISSRTKSLRERFGSKRSYSENFKDPPVPNSPKKDSTGRNVRPSLPIIGVPLAGGTEPITVPTNLLQKKHAQQQEQMQHAYQQEQFHQQMQHAYQQEQFNQQMQQMHPQEQFHQQFQQMHPHTQDQFHQQMQQMHQQEQFHQQMQQMRRNVQMNVLSEHFNPFAALPEETYCSALDINSQQGDDPRFPWQRDAAIQCDMSPTGEGYKYARKDSFFMLSRDAANKSQEDQPEANAEKSSTMLTLPSFSNYSTGTPFTMGVENPTQAISEKFREAYWPNLSICTEEEEPPPIPKPQAEKGKKKKTSMLQRALSERSRSRRLNAQMNTDENKSENSSPQHTRQIYSPHHIQTLSTNLETQLSIEGAAEAAGKTLFKEVNFNSAPASGMETPPSDSSPQTPPSSLNFIPGTPPSRKNSRRLKFVRKQTHSAPDSFDNDEEEQQPHPVAMHPPPIITHTGPDSSSNGVAARPQGLGVGYYNFDSMQRLLDLSMTSSSKSEKPTFLLTPGGLAVGKDKSGAYMTLPSPNVQNADEQDGPQNVFKKLSSLDDEESEHEEPDDHAPPASALHRRRALVPPKMLTDGYESSTEEADQHSPNGTTVTSADGSTTPGQSRNNRRRSSIVVIPPMQICPGDLLVYSKVLSQRNTLLDIDGSTQSLSVSEDSSRKGKNTWSLLRLFDRSSRSKSESLCGLEEVLSSLQPSEFIDEHLSKYKGMSWTDFVSLWEGRTRQEHKAFLRSNAKWLNFNNSSSTETSVKLSTSSYLPSLNIPGSFSSSTIGSPTTNITGSNTTSGISSLDFSSTIAREDDITASSSSSSFGHQSSQQGTHLDNLGFPSNADNGCSHPSSASVLDEIEHQIHNIGAMTRSRNELKRREALWDLFQSECMFLYDHLMVLKNVFMEPLKKIQVEGFAMFAEPEVLFGNLDELCCVTYSFCKEFLSLILQKMSGEEIDTTEVLVKLFKKSAKAHALTQAYHRYTLNYINALNYLETLRRQVEFNEFEKWCSRDSRCKKLQLTDLLVSPVQHVMRVPLILKEIELRTEDQREKHIISNIIESEENSLRELDDKMKWLKNFERLLEIQRSIVWPSVSELDPKAFIPDFLKQPLAKQPCERLIVSPRRQIVLEGSLHLLDSGKPSETFVLLFDDMLLITRRKKGLHKKKSSITENWASTSSKSSSEAGYKYVVYKQPLSLDRFFIHDVSQQDGAGSLLYTYTTCLKKPHANNLKNTFVLVCLNRFQQIVTVHTFQAPNESVKNLWLSKLRDTMDRWKRTLQNTVFRNQRTTSTTSTATPNIGTTTVK